MLLWSCCSSNAQDDHLGGGTSVGSGGKETGGGGAAGSNGGAGFAPVFDCALAPDQPLSSTILSGPRGYHGLAIDEQGRMYGLDSGNTLIRSSYQGDWMPLMSDVFAHQLAFGAGGDLFLYSDNGLEGLTPDAQRYTVNSEISGYGLRVGPEQQLYVADGASVLRVDPMSGVSQVVVTVPGTAAIRSFDFSPAFDRLYLGISGMPVQVQVTALDASSSATGPLQVLAELSRESGFVDGVAVDACGNLYVANFQSFQLFRITKEGEKSVYLDWNSDPTQYAHGVEFGNGVGGFRLDALYLPMPYSDNKVMEVVVGVPSRSYQGEVQNGPG